MMNPAEHSPAPRRRRRWPAVTLTAVLVLVLAGLLGFHFGERYLRGRLAAKVAQLLPKIEERTGLKITWERAEVDLRGHAALHGLRLAADKAPEADQLLTVERVECAFEVRLRERRAAIRSIKLIHPRGFLERRADGSWSIPDKLRRALQGEEETGQPTGAAEGWRAMLEKYVALPDPPAVVVVGGEFNIREAGAPDRRSGEILHYEGVTADVSLPQTETGRRKVVISVTEGELRLSDAGRLTGRATPLLHLNGTNGLLTLFPGERRVVLSGRANEPAGGGALEIALDLDDRAQMISLLADEVNWRPPAEWLPPEIRIGNEARFSGRVTVHRRSDQPLFLVVFNEARFAGVSLNHPRLAKDEVRDLAAGLTGELRIDPERQTIAGMYLSATLGPARVNVPVFFLRLPGEKPFLLRLRLDTDHLSIQDLLDGMPAGLIPIIKGARAAGYLDLDVHLVVDYERIRDSKLDVRGLVTDFQPLAIPARCDVRRIRLPDYEHRVFKDGRLVQTIVLGPDNPDFVSLSNISPYLLGALAICEDGAFYRHHGFLPQAINESLQHNLRAGRFGRGASTITMQLVKNLFLTNEKTVSRKLQEAMLTWWIEREVEKRRMLEVYFNIIEWGDGLYGVGPACRHYFQRHPAKINPLQAAWLASIIRDPVRYQRMRGGAVYGGWKGYLNDIMRKMTRRGTITQEMYQDALMKDFEVFLAPEESADEQEAMPDASAPATGEENPGETEDVAPGPEELPPFDKPWPPGPTP